jgi:hypothetical protein
MADRFFTMCFGGVDLFTARIQLVGYARLASRQKFP